VREEDVVAKRKASAPEAQRRVRRVIYVPSHRVWAAANPADQGVEVISYDASNPPPEAVAAAGRIVEVEG